MYDDDAKAFVELARDTGVPAPAEDNVFVAAVNNRIIPLPSAINKTDVVSEAESITSEKCLLYVAMTRAQKGVYITSYGKKSDFLKP